MALETQLTKIAINLQQLTDAIVTHTAALQTMQSHPITTEPIVEKPTISGLQADVIITDEVVVDPVIVDTTVIDIHKNEEVVTSMTMQQANVELQGIVGQLGDSGVAVRNLFKRHNAITLAQLAPENYGSFVTEARGLVANQA